MIKAEKDSFKEEWRKAVNNATTTAGWSYPHIYPSRPKALPLGGALLPPSTGRRGSTWHWMATRAPLQPL